jgi:hypothetical protein
MCALYMYQWNTKIILKNEYLIYVILKNEDILLSLIVMLFEINWHTEN